MTWKSRPARQWRTALWAVAALLCPLYYWLRTQPFPRRTAVGVERRLFGVDVVPNLQRTSQGQWLVALEWPSVSPAVGSPESPYGWLRTAQGYLERLLPRSQYQPGARAPLVLAPGQGTWRLEHGGLRYLWRLNAVSLGDRYLSAWNVDPSLRPPGRWVLDLKTGRTFRNEAAARLNASLADESPAEVFGLDGSFETPLSPGLEAVTPLASESGYPPLLGSAAHLLWAGGQDPSQDLVAASTDAAPRYLKLADRAAPLGASLDGRTLFLYRESGLWRLELRKPVVELLREVEVPSLPLEGILSP